VSEDVDRPRRRINIVRGICPFARLGTAFEVGARFAAVGRGRQSLVVAREHEAGGPSGARDMGLRGRGGRRDRPSSHHERALGAGGPHGPFLQGAHETRTPPDGARDRMPRGEPEREARLSPDPSRDRLRDHIALYPAYVVPLASGCKPRCASSIDSIAIVDDVAVRDGAIHLTG